MEKTESQKRTSAGFHSECERVLNAFERRSRQSVCRGFESERTGFGLRCSATCFPKVFGDAGVNAAWKTKPSWYVIASEDNAINPELEKRMAKRANAKTTILKSSHVAMLSKPNEVLDVILDAAKSVSK